jgi:hypothetical protein
MSNRHISPHIAELRIPLLGGVRPAVACRASNRLAAICAKQQTFNISYDSKMHWGQVSILFGVACFAGIALFVMYRKPHA